MNNNKQLLHPNENRIIFYPNTEQFQSYDDEKKGGILINGLYETMKDIIDNNNNDDNKKNFLQIVQDIIGDKAEDDLVKLKDKKGNVNKFN